MPKKKPVMPREPKVEILGPNVPDEITDLGEDGILYHFYFPPPPPRQRQPSDPPWWAEDYQPSDHDREVGKDYSDASYIMQQMWSLSHSDAIATIYAVSRYAVQTPRGFLQGIKLDHSVTVFAAPSIYDEMVRAMIAYQERDLGDFGRNEPCIAVLVQWQAAEDCCEVLWANGNSYTGNPPKIYFQPAPAHQGGAYPSNDPTFLGRLEHLLNDLTPQHQPRRTAKKPITRPRRRS